MFNTHNILFTCFFYRPRDGYPQAVAENHGHEPELQNLMQVTDKTRLHITADVTDEGIQSGSESSV